MAMSGEMGKCEMCGKLDLKAKFKKNKRFCSSTCAKGAKAQQHFQQQNNNSQQQSLSIMSTNEQSHKSKKSKKWVSDYYYFHCNMNDHQKNKAIKINGALNESTSKTKAVHEFSLPIFFLNMKLNRAKVLMQNQRMRRAVRWEIL
jgi:hypothetical protein